MAVLTKTAFYTKWGDPAGGFAVNTVRAISEEGMQEFSTDIKDSCTFGGGLNWSDPIQIGDWDMDATASKAVAHSFGADYTKIRVIDVMIINDASTSLAPLVGGSGSIFDVDATDVSLLRTAAGGFDNTGYDATSFNRGWVTIGYVD
jgi:hypothetical protein